MASVMEFYCHPDMHGIIPEPVPAFKFMPDWYKKVVPQIEGDRDAFGEHLLTVKKCMPVLDAMSLGYVIPMQCDVHFLTNHDRSMINVTNPPNMRGVEFHDIKQLGGKTAPGYPAPAVKFINYWVIKTKPGWSTMVLPLINQFDENALFTCMSGLVDTDRYPKEINFPAIWHAPNYDGSVVAGTPLVVVFPIKRNAVPRKPTIKKMSEREFERISKLNRMQNSRRHVYTNELREPRK